MTFHVHLPGGKLKYENAASLYIYTPHCEAYASGRRGTISTATSAAPTSPLMPIFKWFSSTYIREVNRAAATHLI